MDSNQNAGNEDGYRIERCQGASCSNFVEITTVGANVTSYPNTGLTASTCYSYRVRAYNTAGPSGYSNTASATTSGSTISITIASSPNASKCRRMEQFTPTFSWSPGSPHTISAPSPQGGGIQARSYAFTSWSDAGAQAHGVAPMSATIYTATFHCREQEGTNEAPSTRWDFLSLNETCFGYIGSSTDADWWRITMSVAGTVRVVLAVPSGVDYDLELYSAGGFVCGSYNGTGQGESISCVVAAGTYYARVYGFNGSHSSSQRYGINWF